MGSTHRPWSLRIRILRHIRILDNGCWEWTAGLNKFGYGSLGGKVRGAHRASYIGFVGPVPPGKEIDHTCHNPTACAGGPQCPHRRCVNPDHLEPVTRKENVLRGHGNSRVVANKKAKTHCKHGHPYDEANTYWYRGYRMCRACHCETEKRRYRRNPPD